MTSLKESLIEWFTDHISMSSAEVMANSYIEELEQHMQEWLTCKVWATDWRCDTPIQSTIDEVLRFLKGEEKQ